eukprot:7584870-Ditylum_brightwellii.AAC.1
MHKAYVAYDTAAPPPPARMAAPPSPSARMTIKPKSQAQSDLTTTDKSQLYKDSKNLDETPQNS